MELIKWSQPRNLFRMQDEMNRLFDSFLGRDNDEREWMNNAWLPAADVSETENHFEITADLPGLKKEDIKITLHDNVLTITGQKQAAKEDRKKNYRRVERSYGAFQRSFNLPAQVEGDQVKAEYKDGVLTLTVPKSEESKPRQITVN